MPDPSPPIITTDDQRKLEKRLRDAISTLVAPNGTPPEPGRALVGVALHFAGLVTERLNRLPDRLFLEFLELAGVELLPARAARVPLTFRLARGATRALVPAGTPVSATHQPREPDPRPHGQLSAGRPDQLSRAEPPVFETEKDKDLVVSDLELVRVLTRVAAENAYTDHMPPTCSHTDGPLPRAKLVVPFRPFQGRCAVRHWLEIESPLLSREGAKKVSVSFGASPPEWVAQLRWEYRTRTGAAWQPVVAKSTAPAVELPLPGSVGGLRAELPIVAVPPPNTPIPVSLASEQSSQPEGVPPAALARNGEPIEEQENFFPFAQDPPFSPVFALAQDEALSVRGGAVTFDFKLSQPGAASTNPPPRIIWEYRDSVSGRWQTLPGLEQKTDVADGTKNFTQDGKVVFRCPDTIAPVSVAGQQFLWVRARLLNGDYGKPPRYVEIDKKLELKRDDRQPCVKTVRVSYSWKDKDPQPRTEVRHEFGWEPVSATHPEEHRQPVLLLGFAPSDGVVREEPFGEGPFGLFVGVVAPPVRSERAVRSAAQALVGPLALFGPVPPDASAPPSGPRKGVVWEYRRSEPGGGWAPLSVEDGTDGFQRDGVLRFRPPLDFKMSTEADVVAYWLRARWTGGESAGNEARLRGLLFNTTWADHGRSVEEVLGSSNGEPGLEFRLRQVPVLEGQVVEVHGDAGWRTWTQVPHFHRSQSTSPHYTLDRASGTIRFGDGRRGMIPPRGRANVQARYRAGGGEDGNRPAGEIRQLLRSVASIESVENGEGAKGGFAAESVSALRRRGPATVRHAGRAVTLSDFEDLARQASREVARARAFSGGDFTGRVRVVVVTAGSSTRPAPTPQLLSEIQSYLIRRACPTARIEVTGPAWREVTVTAEVVTRPTAPYDLASNVRASLDAFLHPVTGGRDGTGWAFVKVPSRAELLGVLNEVAGVDYVARVEVAVSDPPVGDDQATLVSSGSHSIKLIPGGEAW